VGQILNLSTGKLRNGRETRGRKLGDRTGRFLASHVLLPHKLRQKKRFPYPLAATKRRTCPSIRIVTQRIVNALDNAASLPYNSAVVWESSGGWTAGSSSRRVSSLPPRTGSCDTRITSRTSPCHCKTLIGGSIPPGTSKVLDGGLISTNFCRHFCRSAARGHSGFRHGLRPWTSGNFGRAVCLDECRSNPR
jgi:hypothetical protein